MSDSREILYAGTAAYFEKFCEFNTTFVINVGRVIDEYEPTGPKVNLAPNHQEFTPPHKKNRRGKYKRSGL